MEAQPRRREDFQVKIPLRIRVGSLVRGQLGAGVGRKLHTNTGAGVGIWDSPFTLSPAFPPIPPLYGTIQASATMPRVHGPELQAQALASSGPQQPLYRMGCWALHSSPMSSGIELPIIVHYCWQLQSLAGLRGDWPDCRGVGQVAGALPVLST